MIRDYSCIDELKQRLPEAYETWDYISRAQYLEMTLFMSNYLLSSQGDRVAMAHSVEMRPPYLDHRIIDFMGKVSPAWRIRGLNEKYLLKKAFHDIVPGKILERQKHPYRAPISTPLFAANNGRAEQYLSDGALKESGLFHPDKVTRLMAKIRSGRRIGEFDNMALAGILSTQMLHQRFISRFPAIERQQDFDARLIDRRVKSPRQAPLRRNIHV